MQQYPPQPNTDRDFGHEGSRYESIKVEKNTKGWNWSVRVVKQEGQTDEEWLARLVEIDRRLRVKFGE